MANTAPSTPTVTAPAGTTYIADGSTTITLQWSKSSTYTSNAFYKIEVIINGGLIQVVDTINWTSAATVTYKYTIPTAYRYASGTSFKFQISCANAMGYSGCGTSGMVYINKLNPPTIGTLSTCNPYLNNGVYTIPLTGGSQTCSTAGNFKRMAQVRLTTPAGVTKYFTCATPSDNNTTASVTISQAQIAECLGTGKYTISGTVVAWIVNSRGTASSYVSKTFTVNINSDGGATPIISGDIGLATSGNGEINCNTCVLAGVTTLTITAPSASGRRGAGSEIKYKFDLEGKSTYAPAAGVRTYAVSGLTYGKKKLTVTAVDSRGLVATKTRYVMVQNYTAPTFSSCSITDRTNNSVTVIYQPAVCNIYTYADGVTAGASLNGVATSSPYTYSLTSQAGGKSGTLPASGQTLNGLSPDLVYTLQFKIKDKVGRTGSVYKSIPSIKISLAVRHSTTIRNKTMVGINCVPQNDALELKGGASVDHLTASNHIVSSDYISSPTVRVDSLGAYNNNGYTNISSTLVSTAANAFRIKQYSDAKGYGTIIRQDSGDFYFLFTNENDANGTWNSLRPLQITKSNGKVILGEGGDLKKNFLVRPVGGSWITGGKTNTNAVFANPTRMQGSFYPFLHMYCSEQNGSNYTNSGALVVGGITTKFGIWHYTESVLAGTDNKTSGCAYFDGNNEKFYINNRPVYRTQAGVSTNSTDSNACITIFDEAKMNTLLGVSNAKITNTHLTVSLRNVSECRVFAQAAASGHTDRWVIWAPNPNTSYTLHYFLTYYG